MFNLLCHVTIIIIASISYHIVQYIHLSWPVPQTLENIFCSANSCISSNHTQAITVLDTKCKFMLTTRRKKTTQPPQLHLNDRPIEQVFECKINTLELLFHQMYHGHHIQLLSGQGQNCVTGHRSKVTGHSHRSVVSTTPAVRHS